MALARIQNKKDTEANWTSANPVLLDGEIISVVMTDGIVRTKTGNGISSYSQLKFNDEGIYSAVQIVRW